MASGSFWRIVLFDFPSSDSGWWQTEIVGISPLPTPMLILLTNKKLKNGYLASPPPPYYICLHCQCCLLQWVSSVLCWSLDLPPRFCIRWHFPILASSLDSPPPPLGCIPLQKTLLSSSFSRVTQGTGQKRRVSPAHCGLTWGLFKWSHSS